LIEGSGGIFEVEVDGEVLFSKAVAGRFPEEGEVTALIRDHA
jgi:selenoprotein W-related protein